MGFRSIVLHGVEGGPAGVRKRLKTEVMRWHPDKASSLSIACLAGWCQPAGVVAAIRGGVSASRRSRISGREVRTRGEGNGPIPSFLTCHTARCTWCVQFEAKWGARLLPADKQRILTRVQETAAQLTALMAGK